jgi:hypothetical protein
MILQNLFTKIAKTPAQAAATLDAVAATLNAAGFGVRVGE